MNGEIDCIPLNPVSFAEGDLSMGKFALLFLIMSVSVVMTFAQKKTFILVRHAEKSATGDAASMAKGDPDLSPEGRERAGRFAKRVKKYKPGEIYSTEYKRTRQTAEPIAKLRGKTIQTYDPAKQADLISMMLNAKMKRFLIIGHSNTVTTLANLLLKKDIFKNLQDTEYGVFWVIRTKRGVVTKVEVFPY